jgi:hypothetical protein
MSSPNVRTLRLSPGRRAELDYYFATHESVLGLTSTFGAFVGLAQTGVIVSGGGKDPEARVTDRKFGQDGEVARTRRVYVRLAPIATRNPAAWQVLALQHGPYDWHAHYTRIEQGAWNKVDKAVCGSANGRRPAYDDRVGVLFLTPTLQARHAARVAARDAAKPAQPVAVPEKPAKGKRKGKGGASLGTTIADTLLALVRADDAPTLLAIRNEGEALLVAAWALYAEACNTSLVDRNTEDPRPAKLRAAKLSRSRRAASMTGRVSSAEVDAWA